MLRQLTHGLIIGEIQHIALMMCQMWLALEILCQLLSIMPEISRLSGPNGVVIAIKRSVVRRDAHLFQEPIVPLCQAIDNLLPP